MTMPRLSRSRHGEGAFVVLDEFHDVFGPFFSQAGATAWANSTLAEDWHVVPLRYPELPQ